MKKIFMILCIAALMCMTSLAAAVTSDTSAPVVTESLKPDLIVSVITPNAGEIFANETNNISATVMNIGAVAAGNFTVKFTVNGLNTNVPSSGLAAGANTTLTITDSALRTLGENVAITVTADSIKKVSESNETNNLMTLTKSVVNNGYKSKRYTGGSDITTQATFDGKYGLVYSAGNTAYLAPNWTATTYTWSSANLPIPAGAMVVSARLYQSYTFNKMANDPAFTMSFNSNTVTPIATYKDQKSYGMYNYPGGLYVYDVTSLFNPSGNSITVTPEAGNSYGMWGAYLVVVYQDPAGKTKKIWINDEFDILASGTSYAVTSDEATAYAPFNGVNASGVSKATAIAILASAADSDKSKFYFNNKEYPGFWTDYLLNPQIGFSSYNVTGVIKDGMDTARIQSCLNGTLGDSMYAMNTILVIEYPESAPLANFTASPTSGKAPLTVAFNDTSTGSPTKWKWNFGDGTTSTQQSPKHKYSKAGKYTVSLTINNAAGSNTITKTNYITVVAKPVANFTASPTSGKVPVTVAFNDTSTGIPTGWKWSFGDGTTSTQQNPKHKYSKAGKYTVSLTIKNAAGSNTVTKTNYITVIAKPVASFSAKPTSGKAPLTVAFNDTSTGSPTKWKWSFGDGTTSTQQNPTHKYSKAGKYTVKLTATNAAGSNAVTKTNYITVIAKPVASFSAKPSSGKAPLTVAFTDASTGTPTGWKWSFGDGTTSTQQNPKHKYSKAGKYTVSLTIKNAAGSNTVTKTNYIKVT